MRLLETGPVGEVLLPGEDGYDDAAATFGARGAPAMVVRPRDPDEVAAAIAHAVHNELALSVRSGGHSPLGHGTNTGGMVIDLARFDAVEVVDADRRIVRVGGGATWGRVAAALDPLGWGLTAGDTTSVGVGGLTLGGGIGWMVRKHGLALDNLAAAQVVTADGTLVTASAEERPDLFWALRGGGGNFGVVTSFDFVAQPVTTVQYGTAAYALDDPRTLLANWRDAMRAAPEELTTTLALMPAMAGAPPSAMLLLCYADSDEAAADEAFEPLLSLGTVTQCDISARRYADILEDAQHPPGVRVLPRNVLLPDLSDEVIGAVAAAHGSGRPTAFAVRSLGGAFSRVPASATAFAHRDAEAMIVCAAFIGQDAGEAEVQEALTPWRTVAAHGTGTYINFQGSSTPEDLAAAYPPDTRARLAAVKRTYDPDNVFTRNHNIAPSPVAESVR